MGAPVAAATGARFAVKAHGSELEYSMRGNAELEAWGARTLRGADAVFVGSAHVRSVLEDVVGHVDRVHEVPPGVDVDEFVPRPRAEALAALLDECRADPPNPGNRQERLPDEGNAQRLAEFLAGDAPTVLYFGKLLYNKGVHVLLEALRGMDVRTLVVGFGDYRRELEHLAPPRTLFTGPLEHRHLVNLVPLADVAVVPSIFPEAFGMVAAEAAAAGCPPLVARHSGLAEVAAGIEGFLPAHLHLISFERADAADLVGGSTSCSIWDPRTGPYWLLVAGRRRGAVELGLGCPPAGGPGRRGTACRSGQHCRRSPRTRPARPAPAPRPALRDVIPKPAATVRFAQTGVARWTVTGWLLPEPGSVPWPMRRAMPGQRLRSTRVRRDPAT